MNIHSCPCQPPGARPPLATEPTGRQARRDPARRHRHLRRARLLQRPGRRRRPRRRRRRRHGLPLLPRQGRPAHLDLRADDEGGDRRRPRERRARSTTRSSGCARSRACTSIASAATATSPSSFRSSCGSRRSSWSASRRRTCANTSASSATSSPTVRRAGAFRTRHQPDAGRQAVLRRARRDGDQLDPQPAQVLARGAKRTRSSISSSAGWAALSRATMRIRTSRRCSAPGRWARRSPRTSPTPACRRCCSTSTRDAARDGLRARAARSSRIRSSRPTHARSIRTGGFDDDLPAHRDVRLDHRSRRRAARRQAGAVRAGRRDRRADAIVSSNTSGIPIARDRRRPLARRSGGTGSARISSIRRATCACSKSSRRADTDPAVVETRSRVRRPPARQRRRRREGHARTSSPIASACTA